MLSSPGHEPNHRAVGIDKSVARTEAATHNVIRAKFRKHIAYFLRRDQPDIFQSERYLLLIIRPQVRDMLFVCSAEQITLGPITGSIPQSLSEAHIEWKPAEAE